MTAARPDLLLVVLDTLTASATGLGRSPATMPALQRIADDGLVFTHAVANAPWTYPSHASLFTGLLPSEHRMQSPRVFLVWDPAMLSRGLPTGPRSDPRLGERWLPALLARAGYDTAAVSNNPWVGRVTGMDHGFARIRDTLSVRTKARRRPVRLTPRMRSYARSAYYASRAVRGRGDLRAADSLARIREWAARRPDDRPSFLFVNLIEAHAPYLTPGAADAVRESRSGPVATFRAMLLSDIRHYVRYNLGGLDRRRYRAALGLQRALQRHAASYLDRVVQDAVRAVRRPGRPFAVVVTSDHGESFGDHEAMWHGFTMDEPGLHVPLVVSGDGVHAAEHRATVGVRDAYATVLELAGLDAPAGASPSLLSKGQPRVTVSERLRIEVPPWATMTAREAVDRVGRLVAVYADGWKLSVAASGERLFHPASDPDERVDRSAEEPDRVAELRRHVPAPAHAEGAEATLSAEEEAEVARHLADLGYLE